MPQSRLIQSPVQRPRTAVATLAAEPPRLSDLVEYTVVVEKSPRNYAAYVPDLPGCVATGTSQEEAVREIRQAIRFHVESLREHGEPVPEPSCMATVVTVAADAGAA